MKEEQPDQITTEEYWKRSNGSWILRTALPHDHPENLYNWAKKTYPNINPEDYGIKKPVDERELEREFKIINKCPHCHGELGVEYTT